MKKCPRWAAMLAALTVIATSTLVPLEGAAAPGPIKLPDDPRVTFGDPDGPTAPLFIYFMLPGATRIVFIPLDGLHLREKFRIAAGPVKAPGND